MRINFIVLSLVLLLCGIFCNVISLHSQDKKEFKELVEQFKSGTNLASISDYWITKGLDDLINGDIEKFSGVERRLIYSLIDIRVNKYQQQSNIDGDILFLVNRGLLDKESANAYHVINILKRTSSSDFSQASISRLSSIIVSNECSHYKELIKLSGILNIQSLIPFYQSILDDTSKTPANVVWATRITLGRMGDPKQVNYCINKVRSIGINDEVVFYLIPDLLYMRNRLVYSYIMEEILNASLTCHSTNPDNPVTVPCSYRLIELIAPYIKDFPVEVYESGDIITDNYEEMLSQVQEWIRENKNSYQLI